MNEKVYCIFALIVYTTNYFLGFAPDDNYGTIDKPAMLDLKIR
ncbi:MAG TPA: hypothetical protein VGW31_15500 [Hanamia sp.]|nr:hypothetical protein [Hanamia sp.]